MVTLSLLSHDCLNQHQVLSWQSKKCGMCMGEIEWVVRPGTLALSLCSVLLVC